MKIKSNDKVMLVKKDESYIVTASKKKFNMKSGIVDLGKLIGKPFGSSIKSHLGKEFYAVKPTVLDLFGKMTRTAQVILPKDIGLILAYTGISNDSHVVDAGTGTGYLSIFLANYLANGKVYTYEKEKRFYNVAKENIKISGLKNIEIKNRDISRGIKERDIDLITLDLQHPEKIIKTCHKTLKMGGQLVIYSPTVEHLMKSVKILKRYNFSDTRVIENIVREWQTERTTRPKTMGLVHTGWLTFARKI